MANPQNQPQGRQNGGAAGALQGARDQLRDASQHIQEGAARVGDQVRERFDTARETAAHGYRQAEGAIARNPTQSVLVGFGVGFGLGVLLTVLMTREERPWYEHYTDSLRNLPDHLRHSLHHAGDSLRHVPDALARHIPDSLRR